MVLIKTCKALDNTQTHSLGIQHAGAYDELEDVLESFQCAENGLARFSPTGHVQIRLQH